MPNPTDSASSSENEHLVPANPASAAPTAQEQEVDATERMERAFEALADQRAGHTEAQATAQEEQAKRFVEQQAAVDAVQGVSEAGAESSAVAALSSAGTAPQVAIARRSLGEGLEGTDADDALSQSALVDVLNGPGVAGALNDMAADAEERAQYEPEDRPLVSKPLVTAVQASRKSDDPAERLKRAQEEHQARKAVYQAANTPSARFSRWFSDTTAALSTAFQPDPEEVARQQRLADQQTALDGAGDLDGKSPAALAAAAAALGFHKPTGDSASAGATFPRRPTVAPPEPPKAEGDTDDTAATSPASLGASPSDSGGE